MIYAYLVELPFFRRDALLVASLSIFNPWSPLQREEEIEYGYQTRPI